MAETKEKTTDRDIREMVCIVCPIGCRLKVEVDPSKDPEGKGEPEVKVSGNKCPRGEAYAREEVLAPKRTVTATCRIEGARGTRRVPVKTDGPLPVEHINDLLSRLYKMRLQAPVEIGTVVVDDVAGTGVKVLTTRTVD